jgi:hypothetical protein
MMHGLYNIKLKSVIVQCVLCEKKWALLLSLSIASQSVHLFCFILFHPFVFCYLLFFSCSDDVPVLKGRIKKVTLSPKVVQLLNLTASWGV